MTEMPGVQRERPIAELGVHTLVSRLALYGLGFLALLLIARDLGPAGQGTYLLAMTLGTIAVQLGSVGFEQAQARLWSERAAPREVFHAAAIIVSAILGLTAAALVVTTWAAGRGGVFGGISGLAILLVGLALPLRAYVGLLRWVLMLDGQLPRVNIALVAGELARTTAVVILALSHTMSVESMLAVFWLTLLVPGALLAPRMGVRSGYAARSLVRQEIALGVRLAPYFVFLFLTLRLDVILLAGLADSAAVGQYAVAVLFAEAVWVVTDSLATAARERQFNDPESSALEVSAAAVRMSLLIGLLAWPVVMAVAPLAISALFGSPFAHATTALWALVPAAAAMAAWRAAGAGVVRFARPARLQAIVAVALALNIALGVLLIPHLDIAGAAIASLVAYCAGAGLSIAALVRIGPIPLRAFVPGPADVRQLISVGRLAVLGGSGEVDV